jgi:hypothetical protein
LLLADLVWILLILLTAETLSIHQMQHDKKRTE